MVTDMGSDSGDYNDMAGLGRDRRGVKQGRSECVIVKLDVIY